MTNKQRDNLLLSAVTDLKKTTAGYRENPTGINWRTALGKLDRLHHDLARPPVPALGPVVSNGLSMLLFAPTHETSGLFKVTGSHYPAFDSEFGQIGRWVIAPEAMTVTRDSSAQGGDAFYATGVSGLKYWCGHIGKAPVKGTKLKKGQRIGQIASIARPHVHWGVDARPLTGRDLTWGRDGDGPNYTFGAPTIGAQLAKALEA